MSNGTKDNSQYDMLVKALANSNSSSIKWRVASKRSRHSERLADRIQKNAEVAEQILGEIKALVKLPDTADQVEKLIDAVQELLDNNAKLREQVGEALEDIPD